MRFRDWVAQYPDEAAARLARRALQEEPSLILGVVAEAIEHVRRAATLDSERAIFADLISTAAADSGSRPKARDGDELAAFTALLRESFALGDGTRVTWGEATVEQHEQRIALLRGMVRGIEETIRRHEEAAARLRQAGTGCLNDLVGSGDRRLALGRAR